jgi:hypothetical protein
MNWNGIKLSRLAYYPHVEMTVNQSWHYGFTIGLNDLNVFPVGDFELTLPADEGNFFPFCYNQRILQGRVSGPVNQRTALKNFHFHSSLLSISIIALRIQIITQ